MHCLLSFQHRLSDFVSWFGSCQHVCSVTQLWHFYRLRGNAMCLPVLSPRRLNCLRASTPVISIENSVFPSLMLTWRPCASHVSSTILQKRACRIHKRHRVVGFKRKTHVIHKREIGKRGGDPVSGVMLSVLIDTCLCFRRHVPGWLCRVVHDLFPDSVLLASCSYFAQHLFVHQVEGNTSQRAPLSTASFRPYNQIIIVWHLV